MTAHECTTLSAEMRAHVIAWRQAHGAKAPKAVLVSLARTIGNGKGAEFQFLLVAVGIQSNA